MRTMHGDGMRSGRSSAGPWILALLLGLATGCSGDRGRRGPEGPPGPPGAPPLGAEDDLPGLRISILQVSGGSGAGGNFRVGDAVSVTFTVTLGDGTPLALEQLDFNGILASGPTFNYQRILARKSDLITASRRNRDGSYTYTFADPIPAVYLPPLNDSEAFGPDDGELQGMPLLSGTYTVGIEAYKNYTIEGEEFRDAANATAHFLFGDAQSIDTRELVTIENCNLCHTELRAHGSIRRDVTHCILCHTAGSEDRNVPEVAGGTPGVSIDFKVMIHKIHNGAHLPSVLGVATNDDGSRDYEAEPKPYRLVGFGDRIIDYSEVTFPLWPNLTHPLPRDFGHSSLPPEAQELEDTIRGGAAGCLKCHGDPDGSGPLPEPAHGALYASQPSRLVCQSCHDDIDWTKPYASNQSIMPPQFSDATCALCHPATGSPLAVVDGHRHPLDDPARAPGLHVELVSVQEAGMHDGDGTFDPGERVRIAFELSDDAGSPVEPSDLGRLRVVMNGPTHNPNLLVDSIFPLGAFGPGAAQQTLLPEAIPLEILGVATGGSDRFFTGRAPIWTTATTSVFERTGSGDGSTTILAGAGALRNHLDVADATGFARDDYVVVADGQGTSEYTRVRLVDGQRLFVDPPLRFAHAAGTNVDEVVLTAKSTPDDWILGDAQAGEILLVAGRFGPGNEVLVTYTSDFEIPKVYRPPFNDSPDLGESWGEWAGKRMLDGTYTVGLWGFRDASFVLQGEFNFYRDASPPEVAHVLVGDAGEVVPPAFLSSGDTCVSCHDDVRFHGGQRRGYETCVLCHFAGTEDRPRYVAGNAPETRGATIDLRTMLHKIHMGAELFDPPSYRLVGFGGAPFPNNFSVVTYEHVEFPAIPGRTRQCTTCHGAGNTAWLGPVDRTHPDQEKPARTWRAVCAACHDSPAALAHIAAQTSPEGLESCAICHGEGEEDAVDVSHKAR